MNVLIAYSSKTGATKKCAEMLEEKLVSVTLLDLDENQMEPKDFDVIIIGSGVRMGMIRKSVRKWIETYRSSIMDKKYGCYICNGFIEQEQEIIKKNFTEEFLENAFYAKSLGGELQVEKLKGFDRFVTNMVIKSAKETTNTAPLILEDRIQELANQIFALED